MKRTIFILLLLLHVCVFSVPALSEKNRPSVIPYPARMEMKEGCFILSGDTKLIVTDRLRAEEAVAALQQLINTLPQRGTSEKACVIEMDMHNENGHPEGYTMDISPERIYISSSQPGGIFYAIQTLKQLIFSAQLQRQEQGENGLEIPCLSVIDQPAYEWRGLMLDVSRHFFSVEYLKKQVDILSSYKMNRLHLHLTDDQGWRIEIKKYPELTQKGAWRTFNRQDSFCIERAKENTDFMPDPRFIIRDNGKTLYGGYYTQDEIKDLVAYARLRHVEIIPEIDMPGHMMAAINLFPELSCTGTVGWGETFSFPLCPCNEATFGFVEDVLDEIAALFPSRYIHIGADEVEKDTWETAACRELMKENKLERIEQLQSYFVERIQKYLSAKGKEIIAWDEVLEGGINPDVNVMFWRNWVGGVPEKAVHNGNHIIFAPSHPLYFSSPDSSLYTLYHMHQKFNSIPPDKQSLIRGAQACVWTEGIPTENRANYLIYPRLPALAEVVWTPANEQNWDSFKQRLNKQFAFLDRENIKHSLPAYALIPLMEVNRKEKKIQLRFDSEQAEAAIYYTTDGSMPTEKSYRYTEKGITVSGSAEICAAIYDKGSMQKPLSKRSVDYHKAIGKPVQYNQPWNNAYPANLKETLTDGYRGGERHNDDRWQGFTNDLDIIIDMEEMTELSRFSATFMQITGPGIYMPAYVEISLSANKQTFEKVLTIQNDIPETERQLVFKKFCGEIKKKKARYVRILAKNKNGQFMFTDEIVVN
ncbi:MAG: family 20 glycosylhydrolase [Tannerellaceae bacterium]|jgi:hexosaminidase|nr:family 20 glycosylhydrolase [Tannerellaceae bacterium]